MEKLVTEWPTVSAKHAPHLGRQFSVTVIRVKAKLVVVGAVAVSRKLLTHSVVFLSLFLLFPFPSPSPFPSLSRLFSVYAGKTKKKDYYKETLVQTVSPSVQLLPEVSESLSSISQPVPVILKRILCAALIFSIGSIDPNSIGVPEQATAM